MALATLLAMPAGFGQTPPQATSPPTSAPNPQSAAQAAALVSPIRIAVLEGDNAVNSIPLKQSVTPIVEVRDENEFPVEGATVVFTLPPTGPGGLFPNGQTVFTTRSDLQGQASAPFTMNGVAGKFQIKVTATAGNRTAQATITQTNSAGAYIGPNVAPRAWYKKWGVWAVAGAAVAAGTVLLVRRGGDSTPTIVFTPGGPVFGGPR
jgi:hypothetical protein